MLLIKRRRKKRKLGIIAFFIGGLLVKGSVPAGLYLNADNNLYISSGDYHLPLAVFYLTRFGSRMYLGAI